MTRNEYSRLLKTARKQYPVSISKVCSTYGVDSWKASKYITANIAARVALRKRRIA